MARYPSYGSVALLVGVMAFAMLASVEADLSLKPIANCWRNKTLAGGYATEFYFGYESHEQYGVTVNVSESNYLTSSVELGTDPITSFLPNIHGLSLQVTVPPFAGITTPIAVQWYLNGYVATVDSASAHQECPENQVIPYFIVAIGSTKFDQTALKQAFAQKTGDDASNFRTVGQSTSPFALTQESGGPVSVYESGYVIYNAFINPNDDSFRAAIMQALGATGIENIYGPATSVDVPGVLQPPAPLAIVPETPQAPQVVPLAHCWEPAKNGFSYFYFGYESTFTDTFFIAPNTPQNKFLGAPANFEPFPVFYPSLNGYVTRVHAPDGSLIQWNLNGSAALLDGANVDYACDASANDRGLTTVAVWTTGTYTPSQTDAAVAAMAAVTHLPVDKVSATWTASQGGFRAEFTLKANGSVTAYTAVYRSVNDFHLANSSLNWRWSQIFGQGANRYSSAGHPNIIGQPLPQSNSLHVPVAHCWAPGQAQGSKIAYFGYLSNYEHTLSYLEGKNNWMANAGGFSVPTILYPGYNGFSVAVAASGELEQQTQVAWNLAGNTVTMNLMNDSLQCRPNRPVSFTISYTGVILSDIDQYQAAEDLMAFVKERTGSTNVQASFEPVVSGFYASVQMKFDTPFSQYAALGNFLASCNRIGSYATKSRLSAMAGNATVQYCQSSGTSLDTIGGSGTTAATTQYGVEHITLTTACWTQMGIGLTAYFGYTSDSPLSYYANSTMTPEDPFAIVPIVFSSASVTYATSISTTARKVSWALGTHVVSLDITQANKQCKPDTTNTSATLGFERLLTAPPSEEPVIEWISKNTGYPASNILATWTFDSTSDFVLNVQFIGKNYNPLGNAAQAQWDPFVATTHLVSQLTNNASRTAAISDVVGAHLYYATSGSPPVPPTPEAPTPEAIPPVPSTPPSKQTKHLSGALVFGIIIVVLLGVGIIGGILFYFLKYHKGMCREDVETRPLLAE